MERSFGDENTYIVNGFLLPDGYKTEIKEWEKYKHTTEQGSSFYLVPKKDLVNVTDNTAIILIGEDTGKNLKFENRSNYSVKIIPQKQIYSYAYDDVKKTEEAILNAKMDLLHEKVSKTSELIENIEPKKLGSIAPEPIPTIKPKRPELIEYN